MKKKATGKSGIVIVRTYGAGVHIGKLASRKGAEVVLRDAVRLWYWKGANTLHEASQLGVGPESKISVRVPEVTLLQAMEVIPCSVAAAKTFEPRWP